jgi:hypothetical protein
MWSAVETPHFDSSRRRSRTDHQRGAATASRWRSAWTTNLIEEAIERAGEANSNSRAALRVAAIEMASVVAQLTSRDVSATGR